MPICWIKFSSLPPDTAAQSVFLSQVENNIVWGNTQVIGQSIGYLGAALQLSHNCVETGDIGSATILQNPMFRDTDTFVLEAGSPAIATMIFLSPMLFGAANGRIFCTSTKEMARSCATKQKLLPAIKDGLMVALLAILTGMAIWI